MKHIKEYDYIIINKEFNDSLDKLTSIAISSRLSLKGFNLEEFLSQWK